MFLVPFYEREFREVLLMEVIVDKFPQFGKRKG